MPEHHISIDLDKDGHGVVTVDHLDVSTIVQSIAVVADASSPDRRAQVTLALSPAAVTYRGKGTVHLQVPEHLHNLLTESGWTPPSWDEPQESTGG